MAPGMQMPSTPANPRAGHNMPMAPGMQMPSTPGPANPHAGHDMGSMPQQPGTPANPHAGHDMSNMGQQPVTPANPHAGHDMGNMPQGQGAMPGHDMAGMTEAATDPPVAPPSAAATSGPAHAADTVYPAGQMTGARTIFRDEHGRIRNYRVLIDQLEARVQNGRDSYAWDAEAWYGGALNRAVLKTEGEGTFSSSPDHAEVQALWSRALNPWFNLQTGARYDIRPHPDRGYLVLGVEGIAPYWFEVDGALFLSNKGDLSARVEAEYEQRITQRLILQPRIDLDFSLQDVPELRTGSGLTTAEAGLRLRYEIVPEFAPYFGVHYGRAFGDTARFRRAAGEEVGGWSFILGVRTWF